MFRSGLVDSPSSVGPAAPAPAPAAPTEALCALCSAPVAPVAVLPDADAAVADDVAVVAAPPVLPFRGLIPHMPCADTLGPAETLEELPLEPKRYRRFDPSFGWFTYHAGTKDSFEFILFHPLAVFPFTALMLDEVARDFPTRATPELAAMSAYLEFAKGQIWNPTNRAL